MKQLLLSAIEDMLSGDINESVAICENLCLKVGDDMIGYNVVRKLAYSWISYSGHRSYPVSGRKVWEEGIKYSSKPFWWTGEQLELRMSLLEHIKSEVSKLSEEEFERVLNG